METVGIFCKIYQQILIGQAEFQLCLAYDSECVQI